PNTTLLRQEVHEQRKLLQNPMLPPCSEHCGGLSDPLPKWTLSSGATMKDCFPPADEYLGSTARLGDKGPSFYPRSTAADDRNHLSAKVGIIRDAASMARKPGWQVAQYFGTVLQVRESCAHDNAPRAHAPSRRKSDLEFDA